MHIGFSETEYPDIRGLSLFEDMADEHFHTLMRAAYVQSFPPQIELITEGDRCDFLHIIISGSVDLFSTWNGRETCMATVRPISTFILAATINDARYLMSARTLEKSRIVLVPSQDVRSVFDVDNHFARGIVTELARCYRSSVKSHKDLKLRTSLERLANYLLRLQDREGGKPQFELGCENAALHHCLG